LATQIGPECGNLPVFPISAKFGSGLTPLLAHLRMLYDQNIETNERKQSEDTTLPQSVGNRI
jgi:hypothetical protein